MIPRSRPVSRRRPALLARCLVAAFLVGLCGVVSAGCSGSGAADPLLSAGTGIAVGVSPNYLSFVVVDVDGTATEYPSESHQLPKDAVDGVGVTPAGDVLVTIQERVFVVRDADFTKPPVELEPHRVRYRFGYPQEAYALSTHDGSRVWIVQPGIDSVDDGPVTTLADLVRIEDGELILTASLGGEFNPVGTTAGDRLVLYEAHGAVLALRPDGETELVAKGSALAAGPNHVAVLSGDRTDLTIVEINEDSRRVTRIDPPVEGGTWGIVQGPGIPSISLPWPTLSSDGRLLASFGTGTPDSIGLYMVSVSGRDPTVELLAAEPPWLLAAWTGDYRSVWLFASDHQIQLLDPVRDGTIRDVHRLDNTHFIVAAG